MKVNYILLLVFMLSIFTGCKEKSSEVTITGQLENVEDGTIINLTKSEGNIAIPISTDTLREGKFRFTFKDSINEARLFSIMAKGDGFPPTWLDIWVAPGAKIEISGKDKLIRTWNVESDITEQKELNQFKSITGEYQKMIQSIMTEAYSYFDARKKNPEKSKEYVAKMDSLYAIRDSLDILIIKKEVDLLAQNKTYSKVWLQKLNDHSMPLRYTELPQEYIDKMKNLYENMPKDMKKSDTAQSIYLSLYPPTIVKEGDNMADTDMWDVDGKMHHLADYKGKYILIDFWSSGCGPCIMAIPEMKEISEAYKDKLTIISISSDTKDIWQKVSKEKDISWVNLNDFKGEDGIKIRYGVIGIPHYVMISPEGKVITSWMGYGKGSLKNKMEELIKS
ncbi:MAG TPA: hypothetical protein DIT04_00205 [Dysgonomonas sp.]|nr:hypothetical protein [Dysgonomonas sp.]